MVRKKDGASSLHCKDVIKKPFFREPFFNHRVRIPIELHGMDGAGARDLARAQRTLATAHSVAPMATFLLDIDREVTELTPSLRRLWGLGPDATHARLVDFLQRIHPDDRDSVAAIRAQALETKQPYGFEYRMIRDDGEIRHIRTEGQFFYDTQSGLVRNVGVVVDITEQLHAAEAVERILRNEVLTPEGERLLVERRHLQSGLRGALDRDEFELYFQPIVDARNLTLLGAEALIRWHHPQLGIVPPNVFLPAAEDAGLMIEIDSWVLRHVCDDVAALLRYRIPLRVGVNVTAHSLVASNFTATLERSLAASGATPSALVVEINEQALLADNERVRTTLAALHRAGVAIALDDFGTGYNTLSYLKRYPIDGIKIDRSFVSDLEEYPYSKAVCSGILALASELGLDVVAEGVETEAQEEFLRAQGCDALQGHLYGHPVPRDEFADRLEKLRALRVS
jgi:PAS domain S-box-containing protein